MHYIYVLLCAVQLLSGLSLIIIVLMQESKNEGLTGQIGTTATSSFKGMGGRDEYLNLMTRNIAIVFFATSVLVAFGTGRWTH
jgi:preprotein translocase subunit SecG